MQRCFMKPGWVGGRRGCVWSSKVCLHCITYKMYLGWLRIKPRISVRVYSGSTFLLYPIFTIVHYSVKDQRVGMNVCVLRFYKFRFQDHWITSLSFTPPINTIKSISPLTAYLIYGFQKCTSILYLPWRWELQCLAKRLIIFNIQLGSPPENRSYAWTMHHKLLIKWWQKYNRLLVLQFHSGINKMMIYSKVIFRARFNSTGTYQNMKLSWKTYVCLCVYEWKFKSHSQL